MARRPNTSNQPSPEVRANQARERAEKYWLGRHRYWTEDGLELPDTPGKAFGTDWYKMDGMRREVCVGLTEDNKPRWAHCPDAPPPEAMAAGKYTANTSGTPSAAPMPPFDWRPPAYASDTSGGPANFDGYGGGLDNPRDPVREGESNEPSHDERLAQFQATLKAKAGEAGAGAG